MESSQFLLAFNEGRSARRDGLYKRDNPYFFESSHHHLKKTWEGGWEYEAYSEGCAVSAEIKAELFDPIEAPLLAHIYRFVQHSIELDEESFTKELQSLTVSYLPNKMARITVFLPKNEEPHSP